MSEPEEHGKENDRDAAPIRRLRGLARENGEEDEAQREPEREVQHPHERPPVVDHRRHEERRDEEPAPVREREDEVGERERGQRDDDDRERPPRPENADPLGEDVEQRDQKRVRF